MESKAQDSLVFAHLWLAPVTASIIYSLLVLIKELLHPLRAVPGPLAARFTRLWYLRAVNRGSFEKTNINLHKAYGPIVRIAPGQYSFDDPESIRTIYSHSSLFVKALWYLASSNPNPESRDLFTDVDPRRHGVNRRKVASLYSMSSMVQMESCVAECTAVLMKRLSEFAASSQSINLQQWMQFYAFDAIGLITVNKRFGFLDSGKDQEALIAALHSYLVYASHVGGGIGHLAAFTSQQIAEGHKIFTSKNSDDNSDPFLKRLLRVHSQNPEKISQADIFTTCITNIGAGSDSTSVSLTAILYNLCKHPKVYRKLREEIELAQAERRISVPDITFHEAQALPYLQACIKEGLRLYPATGLPLARVVPKGGATLCGKYFPEGEIVGVNAWVSHRNKAVFGSDADSYRPERWLEDPAKVSELERNFLSFGAGARTCIGKNISLMEMSKLIPALIARFEFELVNPGAEVTTQNVWFVKQLDIQCRVRLREA